MTEKITTLYRGMEPVYDEMEKLRIEGFVEGFTPEPLDLNTSPFGVQVHLVTLPIARKEGAEDRWLAVASPANATRTVAS